MAKSNKKQKFGGQWTIKKLDVLKKYLSAYTTILKKYPYKIAYIDAFAGTGVIKNKSLNSEGNLFGESIYSEQEVQEYIKGSAKISLEIEPQFDKYIFVELESSKANELRETINNEHEEMLYKIEIKVEDSNNVLKELCKKTAQPILHSSFLILHLLSGMTMKHIKISMYVPMIIASVIRELHEPQHHKPSKQSLPREGKY